MRALSIFGPRDPVSRVMASASRKYGEVCRSDDLVFETERMHALAVVNASKDLRHAVNKWEETRQSLGSALLQAAGMGLSLNPTLAHCYLIPRRKRKRRAGEDRDEYLANVPVIIYPSPSYRGLIYLPVRAGLIRYARAEVVYRLDKYRYFGPDQRVEYELLTEPSGQVEPNAVAVFAVARTTQGDYLSEQMPRDTVLRIRAMSDRKESSMWSPDKLWTEGWRKAVLRRLYKTMPISSAELDVAMTVLNEHEGASFDRDRDEESGGSVLLVSEGQVNHLRARVVDSGRSAEEADRWLRRLARTFGVTEIGQLPASRFADASAKLDAGLGSPRS